MTESLQDACHDALMTCSPEQKCLAVQNVHDQLKSRSLVIQHENPKLINQPGRPEEPTLVAPRLLAKRGIASQQGRNRLMHAVAHIEFNAINLALDAAYRFASQPEQFYLDWVRVAAEEAKHFQLITAYLNDNGVSYGDMPAHDGLWDMCKRTSHDLIARMALVPRVLEARGLDVTPGIIKKLEHVKDQQAVAILQVIYQDEIDHVRIGSHWFVYQCQQQSLEPETTFLHCVEQYLHGELRGSFNLTARQTAGFTQSELAYLQKHYSGKPEKKNS